MAKKFLTSSLALAVAAAGGSPRSNAEGYTFDPLADRRRSPLRVAKPVTVRGPERREEQREQRKRRARRKARRGWA